MDGRDDVPKLFITAIRVILVAICGTVSHLEKSGEVTVQGSHFLQEDSPHEIVPR